MTSIKILLVCILIVTILTAVIGNMFLTRNDAVCDFRCNIVKQFYKNFREKINKANTEEQINSYMLLQYTFDTLLERYTYDEMLYSFKPLKLEEWYTEEEIRLINGDY